MPKYEYEARTLQGAFLKGKLDASSEDAVALTLRGKGYYPTRIKEYKEIMNVDLSFMQKVKIKDIAIFCRQFSVIVNAGITIMKGLEIVQAQTESKKLRKVLGEVFDDVQKGKSLSEAMKKQKDFPDMLSNMVTVGESSGTLDSIMERMATFYDKENKLNQKIKSALTYPMAISIFAVGVVILLITKVIPVFVGMLSASNVALPLPTKILLNISKSLTTKWYVYIGAIALLTFIIRSYVSSKNGKNTIARIKMTLPVFGKIYRKIVTARFARTFGTLMGSGIPLINSIEICSDIVGNVIIKDILDSTKDEIKKGLSIGETLETRQIFPPMLTQMIKIGEESGTLDSILEKTAEFYDDEVDTATTQLTALIEPVIIVLLAVVVGFIIISIILPMFSMYDAVGKG
jgi:type IV pilus assembly protein PilC